MILQNWGSPDVVTESFLRMTTVRSGCTGIVLHVSTDPGSFCCGMEKWTTVRGSPNPCKILHSQKLEEHEPNRFFGSYKKYVSEAIQFHQRYDDVWVQFLLSFFPNSYLVVTSLQGGERLGSFS